MGLIQIFANGGTVAIGAATHFQDRHLPSGIAPQKIRVLFPIQLLDKAHLNLFFGQTQTHFA